MLIKTKLTLIVVIPSIVISIFLLISIIGSYKQLDILNKIKSVTVLASKISAVLHNTQRERGSSAGFISSKGEKFSDVLSNVKQDTDITISDMMAYYKTMD